MTKLTARRRKELERILIRYPDMNREIQRAREEIMTPWTESDTNVGGSRSGNTSEKTANLAIKLAEDTELSKLKHQKQIIEELMACEPEEVRDVIACRYFSRPTKPKWERVSFLTSVSIASCYRYNNKILELLDEKLD